MGSQIEIWHDAEEDRLDVAVARFAENEKRFSRFSAESELSQLNQRAGEWVTVSAEFWQLLQRALDVAHVTDGYFDPTILAALERVGYDRSFEQLNDATTPSKPLSPVSFNNYRSIERNESRHAVRLPLGVRLDFGGIAKAYTAQQVVEALRPWGGCLVDAGGDLVAGSAPKEWAEGWPVSISAPSGNISEEEREVLRLWLVNGTLATSGIDYRRWQQEGKLKHHIIDPKTGDSAETDLLTVTIWDADACSAEAWATASLIMGKLDAFDRLTEQGIRAVLIDQAEQVTLTPAFLETLND